MDREELAAWLRLTATPRFSRESARRLLAAFASPQAVLAAGTEARKQVVAAGPAAALAEPPEGFGELLQRTLDWLADTRHAPRWIIPLGDARYPAPLLETGDPPLLLHAVGRLELLTARSIAVVGSRSPTAQGRDNARDFARHLGQAGLTVVSGMALGVDAAAHEGALDTPGSTVAVVGNGLDTVYPRRHAALARRIAEGGLIVSEYSLGTPALAQHFPERNRIIAGLATGTLVVEAALQSGSLITARLAVECGREVFAIPGSIHSPLARGCHQLIRQGAKLVETATDVLDELQVPAPASAAPNAPEASADDRAPLDAMGFDPVSLDALIARTGRPAADLNARLLELELDGLVARLPGGLFQRRGRG